MVPVLSGGEDRVEWGQYELADQNGAFVFDASTHGIPTPPTYLPWFSKKTENPDIL